MIKPQIVTKTVKTVVAGQVVSLGEVEIEDPSLVLSTYEVVVVGDKSTIEYEPPTVELSYLGEGTITVTNPNPTALSATYDSVTRTITLVSNQSEEDDNVDVNLTVSLNRSGNCVAESVTLTAHCFPLLLDPQLTLSGNIYSTSNYYDQWYINNGISYYHSSDFGGKVCVKVNYLGNGEVTSIQESGEPYDDTGGEYYDNTCTWNATEREFTYGGWVGGTQIISLSASSPYTAASVKLYIRHTGPQ